MMALRKAINPRKPVQGLFRLMWPYKGWMVLSIGLWTLTVGSGIGLMATSAWLISAAALQPSISELSIAIVGVRFFGISRAVFRYLERLTSHSVTLHLLSRLRTWFYSSIEPLAPAALTTHHGGDLLGRIVSDVETLQEFYVRAVAPPLVALIVSLGMLAFMASFQPILAIGLLPFLLIAGFGLPILVRLSSARPGRQLVVIRSKLQIKVVDSLYGLADLIVYGQDKLTFQQVQGLSLELAAQQRRLSWIVGFHEGAGILLSNLSMWIILVLAIALVGRGVLDGVYLATLSLGTLALYEAFQPLPHAAQQMDSSLQAAERLFEIVDNEPQVADHPFVAPQPEGIDLRIRDLRFRYRPDGPWILDKISFELPPGKWVAIVGPSGAGKSTLANVLFRLWEYDEGQLLLAGRDLREYAQEDVRQLMSIVAQDSYIFNASVDENIRIANPKLDEPGIQIAAQAAHLHDFIKILPKGYATRVGELGMQLSGGQRQRLVTARAIAKGSPIMILDEPTANLDQVTARSVLDTVLELVRGNSLLLITHHLLGMERMDEILVLNDGKIVERGTHEELLRKPGLYARMWRLQYKEVELV